MTLTDGARWGLAGGAAGISLVLMSPLAFAFGAGATQGARWYSVRGEEPGEHPRPTVSAYILHASLILFALYAVMLADWPTEDVV